MYSRLAALAALVISCARTTPRDEFVGIVSFRGFFSKSMFSHFRFSKIEGLLGLCLLFSANTGQANEAPLSTTTAPLPIRQALQTAWRNHPNSRITESLLAAARARTEAASRPLYNPELEFNSDKEGADRTVLAGVNMAIDINGKRNARRDVGTAQLQFEEAQAHLRRRNFAANWLSTWSSLQGAQQAIRVGNQSVDLMTRFAALAEKQFKVGDISSLERDLALLARDEAQSEQANLMANLAEMEESFRNTGGEPDQLSMNLLSPNALPTIHTETTLKLEALPEWHLANANALAAQRLLIVAKKDRIADPTLGFFSGRIDYGNVTDNVAGITLSIPLYLRNSYNAEVIAAQADSDAASTDVERVIIELQSRAKRTTATYAAMQKAAQLWRSSKGTSVQRRSELLENLWRAGELSTADYLLQLKQTLDTELAGAELESRLWRSSTEYLSANGQLESWLGLDNTYNGETSK
jgi:cobalt-zinc-cadmium efflux system outer membrane protein